MEYRTGSGYSIEKLLDFGNTVFGDEVSPGGFQSLLPKLQYTDMLPEHFRLILEEGEIKAMLLSLPLTVKVFQDTCKLRYIGLVSVHPAARGKGYMKYLMDQAIQEMKEEKISLSILGGQRQRYGYFGYEFGGLEFRCKVSRKNVNHTLGTNFKKDENICNNEILGLNHENNVVIHNKEMIINHENNDNISIKEMKKGSKEETQALLLFQQQNIRTERSAVDFYEVLQSWRSIPYAIYNNDEFIGYLSVSKKDSVAKVNEFYQKETTTPIVQICKACMEELQVDILEFTLPLYDMRAYHSLALLCETYELGFNHSIQIFDFQGVLQTFLLCKAKNEELVDGEVVFKIEETIYRITVKHGIPLVEVLHNEEDHKDMINFTAKEAIRQLFSPLGLLPVNAKLSQEMNQWFPLPLYLSILDAC